MAEGPTVCPKCSSTLNAQGSCESCGTEAEFQAARTLMEGSESVSPPTLSPPHSESQAPTVSPHGAPTLSPAGPDFQDMKTLQGASLAPDESSVRTISEGPPASGVDESSRTIPETHPGSSAPASAGSAPGSSPGSSGSSAGTAASSKGGILPSQRSTGAAATGGILPSHKSPSSSSGGGRASVLQSGPASFAQASEGTPALFDNGKYEIVKEIARGGMGAVYKARQRDLNRVVALKVMLSGSMASEGEKKRFLREAEASAKLKHPHIVPVYDIGEVDGNLYFTMDFVEGAPLSDKKKEFDRQKLLDVMIKTCDAVAYAHMRGIIHRDLKPANVMIDKRGEPLIMDFGLAKETSAENEKGEADVRTREGSIMGTPHYMPPEQAEGAVSEIDVRSDVYALGVILYELWTGKLPFNAKRVSDLMRMVIEQEPASPRSIDPSVPWEIEAIALKAMEKQKAKRYDSAMEMKRDLERFKSGELIQARKANAFYRFRKWVKKNRFALAGAAVLFATISGLGVVAYRASTEAERKEREAREKRIALGRTTLTTIAKDVDDAAAQAEALRASFTQVAAIATGARGVKKVDDLKVAVGKNTDALKDLKRALGGLPDEIASDVKPAAAKAGDAEAALAALVNQVQNVRDAEQAFEERAKLALDRKAAAERSLATARSLHEKTDDESTRAEVAALAAARNDCYAAIGLGAKDAVQGVLDDLARLDAEIATRKERAERHQKALAALDVARQTLGTLIARAGEPQNLEIAKQALAHAQEGLRYEDRSRDLETAAEEARLAYAKTLFELGNFTIAALEADAAATPRGRKASEEYRAKGAAAEIARRALADAESRMTTAETAKLAQRVAAAQSLEKEIAALKLEDLVENDRPRFERVKTWVQRTKVEGGAALLADDAEEYCDLKANPAARPDVADEKVDLAIRELRAAPEVLKTVGIVVPADAARVAALEAACGAVHERAAERFLAAQNWASAKSDAEAAVARFRRAGKAAANADLILKNATAELETPTGMVRVPDTLAVQLGGGDRNPRRTIERVPAFYVARLEVTNEEFADWVAKGGYADEAGWRAVGAPPAVVARFVDRTGQPGPAGWENGRPPRGREKNPVTGISWYEAAAFAAAQGKRLPTDEEWEVAARVRRTDEGGVTRLQALEYAWGDEWDAQRVLRSLLPVGPNGANPRDVSPAGCFDMAGNVSEWVAPSSHELLKTAPEQGSVRGGSFLLALPETFAARRRATPQKLLRAESVGLRLAKNAEGGNK